MKRSTIAIGGVFISALLAVTVWAQAPAPKPAVPLEPISAILEAFKTHQIVALGEGAHGNEQGHAFRLALIRDPRFAATVNDIVVESGNARYQDVMDRYINGGDVSRETLRRVWEDTTVPSTIWDRPIRTTHFLISMRTFAITSNGRHRTTLGGACRRRTHDMPRCGSSAT